MAKRFEGDPDKVDDGHDCKGCAAEKKNQSAGLAVGQGKKVFGHRSGRRGDIRRQHCVADDVAHAGSEENDTRSELAGGEPA